jgi:hypothetical protein
MKRREARFATSLLQPELPRLPKLLQHAGRFGLVLGRIFTQYPDNNTFIEIVGTSGQNYDRFVDSCRNDGFDLVTISSAEVQVSMTYLILFDLSTVLISKPKHR